MGEHSPGVGGSSQAYADAGLPNKTEPTRPDCGPPWSGTSLTTSLRSSYRSDVVEEQRRVNALGYGPLAVYGHHGPVTAGVA
jgi:hypothetical protein